MIMQLLGSDWPADAKSWLLESIDPTNVNRHMNIRRQNLYISALLIVKYVMVTLWRVVEAKVKVYFLLDRCGIQNILYTCSFVLESLYICSYVATMFLY